MKTKHKKKKINTVCAALGKCNANTKNNQMPTSHDGAEINQLFFLHILCTEPVSIFGCFKFAVFFSFSAIKKEVIRGKTRKNINFIFSQAPSSPHVPAVCGCFCNMFCMKNLHYSYIINSLLSYYCFYCGPAPHPSIHGTHRTHTHVSHGQRGHKAERVCALAKFSSSALAELRHIVNAFTFVWIRPHFWGGCVCVCMTSGIYLYVLINGGIYNSGCVCVRVCLLMSFKS